MGTLSPMPEQSAHDLTDQVRVLRALRAHVMDDERALAASRMSGLITARAAFDEHVRIGQMRADDHRLTGAIRRQATEAHPSLAARAERVLLLVDEVLALEHEAAAGDDPAMRRAMARQAEAELVTEAEALGRAMDAARATRTATPAPAAPSAHGRPALILMRD